MIMVPISLRRCAGWSAPLLFASNKVRSPRDEANLHVFAATSENWQVHVIDKYRRSEPMKLPPFIFLSQTMTCI